MTTTSEFLLARIAEDEQVARDAGADAMAGTRWKHFPEEAYNEIQSLVLESSRRILDECATRRTILDIHQRWDETTEAFGPDYWQAPVGDVIAALALEYASHPDFDPLWAE